MAHIERLEEALAGGAFNSVPGKSRLADAVKTAQRITMPISYGALLEQVARGQPGDAIDAYLNPFFAKGKLVPIDGIVAIEDETSVVLVGNHARMPKTAQFFEYRAGLHEAVLLTSTMTLMQSTLQERTYNLSESYVGLVRGQAPIEQISPAQLAGAFQDLVNSMNVVLDQIAYLGIMGELPGAPRPVLH